jgi:hypothetical protein
MRGGYRKIKGRSHDALSGRVHSEKYRGDAAGLALTRPNLASRLGFRGGTYEMPRILSPPATGPGYGAATTDLPVARTDVVFANVS